MMFADATPSWESTLSVLAILGTAATLIFVAIQTFLMKRQGDSFAEQTQIMRKQMEHPTTISPQPLEVTVVEEMHKQFAAKNEFDKCVAGNTARHAQLFQRIDSVERTARKELLEAINGLNGDHARTMEKLTEQITFIRENISEIKTELKVRNE